MKPFYFEAWIHPKTGGDDYQRGYEITCDSIEIAKEALEKALKKISCITNDYKEITKEEFIKNT